MNERASYWVGDVGEVATHSLRSLGGWDKTIGLKAHLRSETTSQKTKLKLTQVKEFSNSLFFLNPIKPHVTN